MSVHNKEKAIELRHKAYTYSEIAKTLKVSRSAVCGWVKNLKLTDKEREELTKKRKAKEGRGRLQASMTLRTRTVFKQKKAYESAEKEFAINNKDPFFLLGLGLTGLEKRNNKHSTFQFTTMNIEDMSIMLKWMEKYLDINRNDLSFRLFVTKGATDKDHASVWTAKLDLPKSCFLKAVTLSQRKRELPKDYIGSLSLSLSKIAPVRKLVAWQKLTIMYYS